MKIITQAIDKLSNNLRLFVEENLRFKGLLEIDIEEAINNVDRSFENILGSIHSVNDSFKNIKIDDLNNYAETSVMIFLRNALYHDDHLLFHSWNKSMYIDKNIEKMAGAEYLFANTDCQLFQVYYLLKLEDFYKRLDLLSQRKSKNNEYYIKKMKSFFDIDLKFMEIVEYSKLYKYPTEQVYLNVIPILMLAVREIFTIASKLNIEFKSHDSIVYLEAFTEEKSLDITHLSYETIRIPTIK